MAKRESGCLPVWQTRLALCESFLPGHRSVFPLFQCFPWPPPFPFPCPLIVVVDTEDVVDVEVLATVEDVVDKLVDELVLLVVVVVTLPTLAMNGTRLFA